MIADLFLRTYPGDYRWLKFLMRSLVRHAREWRDLVIVVPAQSEDIQTWNQDLLALETGLGSTLSSLKEQLVNAKAITGMIHVFGIPKEFKDDYLGQCVTKLRAFEYTDADEVAFLDSDLVLVNRLEPETLHDFYDAPCIELELEHRPWDSAPDAKRAWYEVTKDLLGEDPPFEFMCRHPFQYPVNFLRRVWRFLCERRVPLEDGRRISEFNLLGNYAYLHERNHFCFVPADRPIKEEHVHQFWSWGGITIEVEDELRRLSYWQEGDKRDS